MPLDRQHITTASLVMLPWYFITDAVFGVLFITDPLNKFGQAPSLDVARDMLPLDVWGGLWLALAAMMVLATIGKHRDRMILALWISGIAWFLWGCVTEAATFTEPAVTLIAGWFGWTLAVAQYASIRSLRAREI